MDDVTDDAAPSVEDGVALHRAVRPHGLNREDTLFLLCALKLCL